MKRIIVLALLMALMLTLALPSAALAKKGGVPARGEKAAASSEGRGNGKAEGKQRGADPAPAAGEQEPPGEESDADDAEVDLPEEMTKVTGIENALARLQRNLERKQADYDAGLRGNVPGGLQGVIAKFMSWLGLDAEGEPDAEEGDGGSEETSATPEPDDGEGSEDAAEGDGAQP